MFRQCLICTTNIYKIRLTQGCTLAVARHFVSVSVVSRDTRASANINLMKIHISHSVAMNLKYIWYLKLRWRLRRSHLTNYFRGIYCFRVSFWMPGKGAPLLTVPCMNISNVCLMELLYLARIVGFVRKVWNLGSYFFLPTSRVSFWLRCTLLLRFISRTIPSSYSDLALSALLCTIASWDFYILLRWGWRGAVLRETS